MTQFFLGVDVGGTKTHALVADETGQVRGGAQGGTGSWEAIGYDGLTRVLSDVVQRACQLAGILPGQLAGSGLGLAGYDWPSQTEAHRKACWDAGLNEPIRVVNDAVLGILAGAEEGWGISIVSGTGCNCRGWNRDHSYEGRVVGGWGEWSGEAAGGFDILARAMRAVVFEWNQRGPATQLSQAFLRHTGAIDLDDLVEGLYLRRYHFDPAMVMLVFEIAHAGDVQAVEVMRWAGEQLGGMALGVVNQLRLRDQSFDVVLIGSIYDGHPLIQSALEETIQREAPGARLVRLAVPPVVGGVLLGMEAAGQEFIPRRSRLVESTRAFFAKEGDR
jgi:N-acetylglucosamine kinase-like BadF-type ATPase